MGTDRREHAVLSPRLFAGQSARQSGNLVARNREVVVDDDRVGKSRPLEFAIDLGRDCHFAALVVHVEDFQRDLGIHDLAVAPGLDRVSAAELPAGVMDDGTPGEAVDESGRIVVVRGPDVGGGNLRQCGRHKAPRFGWLKTSWSPLAPSTS